MRGGAVVVRPLFCALSKFRQEGGYIMSVFKINMSCDFHDGMLLHNEIGFPATLPITSEEFFADLMQLESDNSNGNNAPTRENIHQFFTRCHEVLDSYEKEAVHKLL